MFPRTVYWIRTCVFVFIVLHFAFSYNTQHKHPCLRRDSNSRDRPQTYVSHRTATGMGEFDPRTDETVVSRYID